MFERNFMIESMERDPESGYWTAIVSYTSGILGLTKKQSQFILIAGFWVNAITMSSMPKDHFLEDPLRNMLTYKKQIERNKGNP